MDASDYGYMRLIGAVLIQAIVDAHLASMRGGNGDAEEFLVSDGPLWFEAIGKDVSPGDIKKMIRRGFTKKELREYYER